MTAMESAVKDLKLDDQWCNGNHRRLESKKFKPYKKNHLYFLALNNKAAELEIHSGA